MTTLSQDAAALRKLDLKAKRLKAAADEAKAEADIAEVRFFERMEAEDTQGIKVGNTNFVRAETAYGQIQDREAFVAWAEENAPEMVEPRERKKLVNELVHERLDNGEELPPGVGFYVKQYVSQRVA